jgi:hypothetical protein
MSRATLVEAGIGTFGNIATLLTEGLASYTNLPQPPVSGYEYATCNSITWTGQSLQAGSMPAVVIGDIFVTQTTTANSGYAITINGDGTINIAAMGDTSRQSFLYEIFRIGSNTLDGPATVWVNEVAPVWNSSCSQPAMKLNVAITPVNFASPFYAISPSGDVLTFTLYSGNLPLGLNLSSTGILSGTPIATNVYTFQILATDITGTGTVSQSSQIGIYDSSVFVVSMDHDGPKQTQVVRESHYNKRKKAKIQTEKDRKAGKRTPEQIAADEQAIQAYMEAEAEHIDRLITAGVQLIQSLGVH